MTRELAAIDALKDNMERTLPSKIQRVQSKADGAFLAAAHAKHSQRRGAIGGIVVKYAGSSRTRLQS